MHRTEYLLICLAEECQEVAHRVSKALRFTCEEVQPGGSLNNAERIAEELVDLIGVMGMLVDEYVITNPLIEIAGISRKREKIEKFIKYSQQLGVLEHE